MLVTGIFPGTPFGRFPFTYQPYVGSCPALCLGQAQSLISCSCQAWPQAWKVPRFTRPVCWHHFLLTGILDPWRYPLFSSQVSCAFKKYLSYLTWHLEMFHSGRIFRLSSKKKSKLEVEILKYPFFSITRTLHLSPFASLGTFILLCWAVEGVVEREACV